MAQAAEAVDEQGRKKAREETQDYLTGGSSCESAYPRLPAMTTALPQGGRITRPQSLGESSARKI